MCNYIGPRREFFRPEEVHDYHVMIGMETGSFEYAVGKDTGTASFGDLLFVPPGSLFKRKALGEITFHMLVFSPPVEADALSGSLPSGKVTINDVNRLSSNYSYLRKIWLEYGSLSKESPLSMHILMDLLHLSLLEYKYSEKRRKKAEPRMQLAAGYIHRHLFDELSMKRIADDLGLKPSDLTRRFRLEYGVTPIEYATTLRLEEAKKLLLETDYTLDMIASLCGYENGSYLARVFRSKVGVNPSVFRRNQPI